MLRTAYLNGIAFRSDDQMHTVIQRCTCHTDERLQCLSHQFLLHDRVRRISYGGSRPMPDLVIG
jgi:hypothetical protein